MTIIRSSKQIGEALRRERRARKMTQTQLAHHSGLRQELISKIETGSPGTAIDSIFTLLTAMDLEFDLRPRSRGDAFDIEDIF